MVSRFKTCSLDQPLLLPPDLRDWLPESHLARFIAEVVEKHLDLSKLMGSYQRQDARGRQGYHPEMLCRVLLYGYCVGVLSSRKIEAAICNDVAFRFLAGNQQPDHCTIAEFRKEHVEDFEDLFVKVLELCQRANMMKLGVIALDGTKMKANASRHRSYDHEELEKKIESLRQQVAEMTKQAIEQDRIEDQHHSQPVEVMPEGMQKVKERLAVLEQAKQRLEEEARQRAEQSKTEVEQAQAQGRPLSDAEKKRKQRARQALEGKPPGRANLTDPDSRLVLDNANHSFVQGFNVQAIVDVETQVILATGVTQEAVDRNQLLPMVARLEQNLEALEAKQTGAADGSVLTLLADTGYWNGQSLESEKLTGYRVIVPPDKPRFSEKKEKKELAANAPKGERASQMRDFLATDEGKALYRRRQSSIEPVYGQVKECRKIRAFLLRGLRKVMGEWNLICLTHNLLKLFREASKKRMNPLSTPCKTCFRTPWAVLVSLLLRFLQIIPRNRSLSTDSVLAPVS